MCAFDFEVRKPSYRSRFPCELLRFLSVWKLQEQFRTPTNDSAPRQVGHTYQSEFDYRKGVDCAEQRIQRCCRRRNSQDRERSVCRMNPQFQMDPGLVTSERPLQTSNSGFNQSGIPTITCRSCRIQIPMDTIETHECDPEDLKAAASKKRGSDTTVTRASTLMGSFLASTGADVKDKSVSPDGMSYADQDNVRHAEVSDPHQYARRPNAQSINHSPLSSPTSSTPQPRSGSPHHLSRIGRSISSYLPSTADPLSARATESLQQRSVSSQEHSLIQCRVRGVRVNKDRVAVYSIISNILKKDATGDSAIGNALVAALGSRTASNKQEIIIERRYREFYAFARTVYSMFPSKELWQRLPPKTLCFLKNTTNDGFLLRRKNGLDDFVRCAIEMMDLGSSAQGTIGQWYLVRKFLNLPSTLMTTPTKDRSLVAAMHELKKHARQSTGWVPSTRYEEHDAIYERTCDGFQMVKRVRQCPFPARAVFDMVVKSYQGSSAAATATVQPVESTDVDAKEQPSSVSTMPKPNNHAVSWNPLVEREEVLSLHDRRTWVARTTFKVRRNSPTTFFHCLYPLRHRDFYSVYANKKYTPGRLDQSQYADDVHQELEVSSECGNPCAVDETHVQSLGVGCSVEDNGTITIVMIPADDGGCHDRNGSTSHDYSRVDCILGGWVITPTPNDETCTVTWLLQTNFGECDPQSEFTGSQGLTALISRNVLLSWADEITYLLSALEKSYIPSYYRNLGPLLSGGDSQRLKLERRHTTSPCVSADPRAYTLAQELEPCLCLLIHKGTNKNVLVFKTNLRVSASLACLPNSCLTLPCGRE